MNRVSKQYSALNTNNRLQTENSHHIYTKICSFIFSDLNRDLIVNLNHYLNQFK